MLAPKGIIEVYGISKNKRVRFSYQIPLSALVSILKIQCN